ncbi:putative sugar nucleotidyl transferase [Thermoflavifilum thermophilum]|uniref:UDP-N-acetylglucosamine diphosphorylase/glucosamine-1-phosphate N-acetyltransferase n=1 Tax=Thermoflavifilum thermophilum TaxID=1393122 RepID=A0A1I7MX86_9BACT|nr:putative sugar nucleotidyl transferase [Thermoflavifilum thermophilum]SFV26994.1 UDP-N-acetylglucosamine diphosphorylase/glucosamine-1-phosphate N-acetyltransferase [Thermoflavifilum thermophilum]
MIILLFDDPSVRQHLYPLSLTRSIADFRVGILTLREKWSYLLPGLPVHICTEPYLQALYPLPEKPDHVVGIASHLLPDEDFWHVVKQLAPGEGLFTPKGELIAFHEKDITPADIYSRLQAAAYADTLKHIAYNQRLHILHSLTDVFTYNGREIQRDWELLFGSANTDLQQGEWIQSTVIGKHPVYTGPHARVLASIINTEAGPVFIDEGVEIMEGTTIRGPVAICRNAVIKMGTRIYGATTIGPWCTIGGEVKNAVILGYSNKAHEGYLGDSVVGEWCNLGANTNSSNIKNNAGTVRIWNQAVQAYVPAGKKCGVLMGDFSRCGIGTMLNTGTVIGVSCNIFGGDFPPKHIPSFSWGGADRWMRYDLQKALQDADAWMQLKQQSLSEVQRQIFSHLYHHHLSELPVQSKVS